MAALVDYAHDQERRGLSPGTIKRRRDILRAFHHFSGDCISSASKADVEAWLDGCRLTPRSRYTYLSTLHVFYRWLQSQDASHADPTAMIIRPRLARRIPRPISDADLAYALSQADARMACWLMLPAYAGFRCVEIARLQRSHILEDHDPPLLHVAEGKGGHSAILPLNPLVHLALSTYGLPRSGFVFRKLDGHPYLPGTISYYVSHFFRELGIDATAHQIRHWFGTALWAATKDLRVTQEMMRHAYPTATAPYTAYDNVLAGTAVMGLSVRPVVPDERMTG